MTKKGKGSRKVTVISDETLSNKKSIGFLGNPRKDLRKEPGEPSTLDRNHCTLYGL